MTADELQSAVLRFGLEEPPVPRPVDVDTWRQVLAWAQAHNLVGQFWHAAPTIALLSTAQQSMLTAAYEDAALACTGDRGLCARRPPAVGWCADRVAGTQGLRHIATPVRRSGAAKFARHRHPRASRRPAGHTRGTGVDHCRAGGGASRTGAGGGSEGAADHRHPQHLDRHSPGDRGVPGDQPTAGGAIVRRRRRRSRLATFRSQVCSNAAMFVHSVLHSTSGGAQLSTLPDLGRLARLVDPDDAIVRDLLAGRTQRDLFVWSLNAAAQQIPIPAAVARLRHRSPTGRAASAAGSTRFTTARRGSAWRTS